MDNKGRRFRDEKENNLMSEEIFDVESEADIDDAGDIDDIDENADVVEPSAVVIEKEPKESKEGSSDAEKDESDDEKRRDRERDERLKQKNSKKLERFMKKKRSREERSDRKVLSYEDMPLKERDAEKNKLKVKVNRKRVIIAIIIVFALFVIVFLFANSDRLSLHNISNFIQYGIFNSDSEQRFPVDIQGENVTSGNFQRMGQDLCYASDTRLQCLNNYGKGIYTAQHGYTSPVLVTNSKLSLVYSLGGTGFQVNGLEKNIYTGEAENNILVADIVENGTYALVTQSDGYLSKLSAFDKDNNKIYAYSFADYYITSVSLSSNGKNAVLSGLSALNGEEISALYVLDFTKDTPVFVQEFEDNIIYEVQYLNDSNCAAIGNNAACVINTRSGNVEAYDYNGKTLSAYSINKDTDNFSISLSRSGDGRSCDIISFNTNGTVSQSFSTELRVISMSTYKGRVALLSTDTIYLYNKNGGLVSKKDAGIDPKAIMLYTSADAYILDTSEIRSLTL